MKENSVSNAETEEYKRYFRLLQLNIQLLCEHDPDKVLDEVKKKYYPIEMCLTICQKKQNRIAEAYLLKRNGAFNESLNVYLDLIREIGVDLIDYKKKNKMDQNIDSLSKLFSSALKVCKKNAKVTNANEEEGLWFPLLDNLYDVVLKLYKKRPENSSNSVEDKFFNAFFDKVLGALNKCIKELLTLMMNYVSFPTILTKVTETHGELEIESFKEMFTNMLFSYFYQEKILETATKILGNSIVTQFQTLSKTRSKGLPVPSFICAKCDRIISNKGDTDVVIFPCEHIYHSTCIKGKSTCYACTYKETSICFYKDMIFRSLFFRTISEKKFEKGKGTKR